MDFKEIIKQEWEKEFPLGVDDQPPVFGNSIFTMYEQMVERICARVWNEAIDKSSDTLFDCQIGTELEEAQLYAIEKLKINEQGTDTTEV